MKLHRIAVICAAVAMMAMTAVAAHAESLQQLIERLGEENATAYLRPMADGLGADLNSGIYSTAKPHGIAGFDFGVKVMAAQMPDDAKFFTPILPNGYTSNPATSPTAIGPEDQGASITQTSSGDSYELPGGLDLSLVPLAVPQIAVGVPYNTDVIVRYLPAIEISSDVGDVSFFGIGAKHGLNSYLPMLPLDVSAFLMYQKLKVGDDLLETSNFAYGVCASKSIPILTLYGGFQLESASMDVKYTYTPQPGEPGAGSSFPISLSFDSDASSRATIGTRITLLPFIFVQGEASRVFGSDILGTVFGGGVGLKIR